MRYLDFNHIATDLLNLLDQNKYPETVSYLLDYQTAGEDRSAYELASAIVNCDRKEQMPLNLFAAVESLYLKECEKNDPIAINDLGALYYSGRSGKPDYERAFFCYEKAANLGNQQAQENLGYCYYYGNGTPVNYEKAFHYFSLGAFAGNPVSLYKIGDMYRNGYAELPFNELG